MGLVHYIIEGLISVNIILSFFQKYQDSDTLEIVSSYKSIAWHYMFRGWFFIDIISIIPYELISHDSSLLKLIRLLRLPKLIVLVDISRFDKFIDSLFLGKKNDKLMIMFNIRFLFKIIRLIIIAIIITYFVGCFWYLFCDKMSVYYDGHDFINKNNLENKSAFDKLIISCYFALTTLTTVGYGDYVAVNNSERIFAIFVMLLGVAMFSYVMGSFTELISSYDKKMGVSDKGSDLQNWLSLLGKFSKNKPFSSDLIKKIDKHFAYFWKNDRNASISKNDPYLTSLPKSLKLKVMEFLWGDIFNKFANFFLYYSVNKEKFFKFYYDISFCLLPRRFLPGEIIYKPNEDIEEMYLLFDGKVEIGYSLQDEVNSLKHCKSIKSIDWIGDFYCLFNVKSKYFYSAKTEVKTFGINKYELLAALEKHQELYIKFRTKAYRRYADNIKVTLEKKIDEDIKNFNTSHNAINMTKIDSQHQLGIQENDNGMRVDRLIKSRLEKKNQEIKDIIYEIEKKFVKLDDDYANLSRFLFNLSTDCEADLVRMNSELDEVQNKINNYLDLAIKDKK